MLTSASLLDDDGEPFTWAALSDRIDDSTQPKPWLHLPLSESDITVAEGEAAWFPHDWPFLLDVNLTTLIDTIFWEEKFAASAIADELAYYRSILLGLFCSIPRSVLVSAIDGSLPHKALAKGDDIYPLYNPDPEKEEYEQHPWFLRRQQKEGYAIYVRWLVDAAGLSPTPDELMLIVDCLRKYISGEEEDAAVAADIDNAFSPDTSDTDDILRGQHMHLAGKKRRAAQVHTWCKAIELLCRHLTPTQRTQPLSKPRSYCGYSRNVSKRDQNYRRHQSTTWLVTLVEAVCIVLLPLRSIKLRTYTVCYLATKDEVSLAERSLTRCTDSRIDAGGFCVAPPGQCR